MSGIFHFKIDLSVNPETFMKSKEYGFLIRNPQSAAKSISYDLFCANDVLMLFALFLAVQNSSIGDLVTHSLRDILILTLQSDPRFL